MRLTSLSLQQKQVFKPPQTEFIDKIVYDGSQPNAYLEKFAIGLKNDTKI